MHYRYHTIMHDTSDIFGDFVWLEMSFRHKIKKFIWLLVTVEFELKKGDWRLIQSSVCCNNLSYLLYPIPIHQYIVHQHIIFRLPFRIFKANNRSRVDVSNCFASHHHDCYCYCYCYHIIISIFIHPNVNVSINMIPQSVDCSQFYRFRVEVLIFCLFVCFEKFLKLTWCW